MELYFEEGQVVTEELREKMLRAAGYAVETEDIFGLEPARCEISVSFVGPDEIQALNSEYRGIDRVTFPAVCGARGRGAGGRGNLSG